MHARVAVAVAAALTLLAIAAPALGAGVRSNVKITEYSTGGDDYFFGEVGSPKRRCETGRRVTIYRAPAEPTPIGSDRTERGKGGLAVFEVPYETNSAGVYFAKVKRQRKGNVVCNGDRSPNFGGA